MENKEINFIINGKDARAACEDIKKIIKDEFDYDSQISVQKGTTHGKITKALDFATLGALFIALPGAILATIDIIDRIRKKEKLEKVIEKIQKQIIHKKKISVRIQYPDGMIKDISTIDTTEILDKLSE